MEEKESQFVLDCERQLANLDSNIRSINNEIMNYTSKINELELAKRNFESERNALKIVTATRYGVLGKNFNLGE